MKKYKHKGRQALLWFLLFLNLCAPLPCLAGIETLPFTDPTDIACSMSGAIANEGGTPWWEAPMSAVLSAAVGVGNGVFSSVAGGAKRLMLVGAALWLAIFTLKIVGGLVESDPMENLTKVGGMMLRVGIAAALLANRDFFFGYFFAPIIEAGSGFVDAGLSGKAAGVNAGGGLDSAAAAAKSMAAATNEAVNGIKGKAIYLICLAKIHKIEFGPIGPFTLWDPGVFFGGCMIYLAGMVFCAVFPFFLIDACFRMGVVAALCPLFIVAWVFQSTRSYATKGLNAVINVAFTFMMVKIAMMVALSLVEKSSGLDVLGAGEPGPGPKTQVVCKYRLANMGDAGADPCNGYQTGMGPGSLFVFCVCVVYGLLLLKEGANSLANYFSETGFTNDTAFQAAKSGAQAAVSAPHNVIQGAAEVGAVARGVDKGVNSVKDRVAMNRYKSGQDKMARGQMLTPKEQKKYAAAESRLRERNLLKDSDLKDLANKRKGTVPPNDPKKMNDAQKNTPTPPKGVAKNAQFDQKSQTWMTTSTDKKTGITNEVHYDKDDGRIVSRTQTDREGRMLLNEQMKNGKTSQITQTFDSKGQRTSKTVSEKGGDTRVLRWDDGKMVGNTVTHSDGSRDNNKPEGK